jgi:hypothetical protein
MAASRFWGETLQRRQELAVSGRHLYHNLPDHLDLCGELVLGSLQIPTAAGQRPRARDPK